MATYVTLIHWTDQGIKQAKNLTQRSQQFRQDCERRGIKVLSLHTTQGRWDVVIVSEAPDDQSMAAAMLAVESLGNVHTETMRAFTESEMMSILLKV